MKSLGVFGTFIFQNLFVFVIFVVLFWQADGVSADNLDPAKDWF